MELRPTILLVEDEILIRLVMSDGLREDGYQVIEAATADEAREILASDTLVHLVVTDINMPGSINGLQLAAEVKEVDPSLPVLIVSSHLPEALNGRADGFVGKPFLHSELSDAISKLIGSEWQAKIERRKAS